MNVEVEVKVKEPLFLLNVQAEVIMTVAGTKMTTRLPKGQSTLDSDSRNADEKRSGETALAEDVDKQTAPQEKHEKRAKDGWIWDSSGRQGMSAEELKQWQDEGKCIFPRRSIYCQPFFRRPSPVVPSSRRDENMARRS